MEERLEAMSEAEAITTDDAMATRENQYYISRNIKFL
jgi:hypothetical protein